MARDPQKLRKAYEYKLGKDLASKLDDKQIHLLSEYYNSLSDKETSDIDSQIVQGRNNTELHEMAIGMGEENESKKTPPKPKAKPKPKATPKAKPKKVYAEDRSVAYKLPDHILKDLDEDQIKDLSAVYNMMSADKKKEFGKGTGDLMDLARQMSDPLQEKYNTGGLDSWTGKPKENSNVMQGPMPMPSVKKPKKEKGALAVIPKPDKVKEETLVDEDIDPRILKLLGIEDTTGLDYSDYKSLLKEKMAADRMGGNKGDSGDAELLTNEYKRVKGNTGKFKVKSQKIKAQSFVAKTKPNSSVEKVTPLLPSVTPQETEQPIQPERQGMDKTLALIASKLNSVDKNVQQTTSNLQNKDAAENKQKNQDRITAENTAAQRKEERIERTAVLGGALAGMKKTVKPLTDMMGGLFDFFKRLGFAMFIMELLKFLKDPKKYINGVIEWINKQIVKLETSIENFVIGTMIKPLNKAINGINDQFSKFIGTVNPILEKLKVLGIDTQIPELKIKEIPESSIRDNFSIPSIPLLGETSPSESGTTQPESQPKETLMGRGRSQSTSSLAAKGGVDQGERAKSQVSEAGFDESDFILYRDVVAEIESKGKYDIQGGSGDMYAGRYQMGAAAREDAARLLGEKYQGDGETARKTFREDKQMQERYFAAYTRANHGYLMKGSPEYKELSEDGKLQVLGYAHNAGWSRAADWLKSGMSGSFKDGFGTRSDKYSTSIRSAQQQVRQPIAPDSDDVSSTTEPAPPPTSVEPLLPPTEDQQQLKLQEQRKRTEELMKGDPRFTPQASVPNITPPVQKASLTTIGGLSGGDVPGTALAAAGGIQSQAYSFSATNGVDLSVLSTKETLRVVGT